jgi:hypothetical protein
MKRAAACAVVVAGFAAATAGPASAMVAPACSARLAAPATGPTGSCSFSENSGWAVITVEPVATTVKATVSCVTSWGYSYSTSRTFSSYGTWVTAAPGYCTLTLASDSPTAVATGTASPWFPIYTEPV